MLNVKCFKPLSMCHMRLRKPDEEGEGEYVHVGSLMLPEGFYALKEVPNPFNSDWAPSLALANPEEVFDKEVLEEGDVVCMNKWSLVGAPKNIAKLFECSPPAVYIHPERSLLAHSH